MTQPYEQFNRAALHVDIYDKQTALQYTARRNDIPYFVQHAQRSGGPVLELAAGTGRVVWPIAEAGISVVGLDLSPTMRARAEAKRATATPEAAKRFRFVEGDMTAFSLDESFPLIIIAYRSFQMLTTPAQQQACLKGVVNHLTPGGLLIVDLFDPRLDMCTPDNAFGSAHTITHPGTGNDVHVEVTRTSTDPVSQTFTETWTFTESDKQGHIHRQEEEQLTMRWIYRYEMRYLLELAGLTVEAEYSDFDESPPAYGKEQIWLARRGH